MICALYARISVEERDQPKYSISAQLARLKDYAAQHNYTIYDTYIDNGVSAATITKRKDLIRMISDLDHIDIVLFTQLDRFSRNVLDANNLIKQFADKKVSFKAIDEDDVDTSTADGKFIFDLKVSLAERERKKTSERIKRVNQYKVQNHKVTFGVGPTGYKVGPDKTWICSEDAPMIQDMFRVYTETGSREAVRKYILEKYNRDYHPSSISHYLDREVYTGRYKGVNDYFPRLISDDTWNEACRLRKQNRLRVSSKGNIYIFRGLVRCHYCGGIMAGANSKRDSKHDYRQIIYRCWRHSVRADSCPCTHQIQEKTIEAYLLANMKDEYRKFQMNLQLENDYSKKRIDVSAIRSKIDRLQDLYVNGMIDMEKFKADYSRLNDSLVLAEKQNANKADFRQIQRISDLVEQFTVEKYQATSKARKWAFWKEIIDYLEVDREKNIKIHFKK